jgi:hypothetical protein
VTTTQDPTEADPAVRQFFLGALAAIRLPVEEQEEGVFVLSVPEPLREKFADRELIRFTFRSPAVPQGSEPEELSLVSPLGKTILSRLKDEAVVAHARPKDQPISVHELTSRLFRAYTVDKGSVRLSGCSLEDTPLLRYTYLLRAGHVGSAPRLVHVFASPDDRPVDDELLAALHVDQLTVQEGRPPRVAPDDLGRWLDFGRRRAPLVAHGEEAEFVLATVVWCKYVDCKLLFEIGDSRAEATFQGWAQLLVDGAAQPPPFRCPATGCQSYRVVATEDGRITVPEAIAVCEETGRPVLITDLETCAVTGRRVLAERLVACPVSGERVLRSALASCSQCRQEVSPHALVGAQCQACRSLQPALRDAPAIARVLGEYPKLDRWSRFRMAETDTAYIVIASAFLRRLLVVLDKESLDVLQLAEGSRLSRSWTEVPEGMRDEYLG